MKYRGFEITIEQDTDAQNPRTEFDNLGTMVCFHRRYNLGDKHEFTDPDHFDKWARNQGYIHGKNIWIENLYLYDHGGITINTTGFSCPWDSGQVGIIYATLADMEGLPLERAERILKAEVAEYDNYLTGNVHGYTIEPLPSNKIDCNDSCWGFYGDDGKAEAISQAKSAIDYAIKKHRESAKISHKTALEMKAFMRSCWAF